MSYRLNAVIGAPEVVAAVSEELSCGATPLTERLSLIPWTDRLFESLGPSVEAQEPLPFRCLHPRLEDSLRRGSALSSVAYVEAEYFGGVGHQAVIVFEAGTVTFQTPEEQGIWPNSPISRALRVLGVVADLGKDEFDTVGLGRHRTTEGWLRP